MLRSNGTITSVMNGECLQVDSTADRTAVDSTGARGAGTTGPPTGVVSVQPCVVSGEGQMFDVVSVNASIKTFKTSGALDLCIDYDIQS